jgi:hypothetical protein
MAVLSNGRPPSAPEDWPTAVHAAVYLGPLGEMTKLIEPNTESDPMAVLIQAIVCFGSLLGRNAYYQVEATRHHTNEFCVLVGPTAKARKGTSLDQVLRVMTQVDLDWCVRCRASGLASGEGIVWRLRDRQPPASGPGEQERVNDAALAGDKRLLVVESEFAAVLKVIRRADNTLSPMVRNAWDGRTLETMAKAAPARAANPHLSVIGHVTRDELLRNVDATEQANGFLNRFLHVAVRSSKSLPFGGDVDGVDFTTVVEALKNAVSFGRQAGRIRFDEGAREVWPGVYERLRGERPGMFGAVTARAEAHVVRLALIYAVSECSQVIGKAHLRAALALWQYAERSARWCYGLSLGDPIADRLYAALQDEPEGLTRREIRDLFNRNGRKDAIDHALGLLSAAGLAERRRTPTPGGGPPRERWLLVC